LGHPIQQFTEEEQLAFRDWELANTESGAARRIARAQSAGDAAAAITRHYERPAEPDRDSADRANIAEAIMRLGVPVPDSAHSNQTPNPARPQQPGYFGRRTGPIRD